MQDKNDFGGIYHAGMSLYHTPDHSREMMRASWVPPAVTNESVIVYYIVVVAWFHEQQIANRRFLPMRSWVDLKLMTSSELYTVSWR